jgi:quinoprotein glucose dehydrogenase
MSRAPFQSILGVVVVGLAWMTVSTIGQSASPPSTKNGEWPVHGDIKGTRYSPSIKSTRRTSTNWKSPAVQDRQPRPASGVQLEGTPLMVKGVLYATAGTRRSVVALDARTGE